MSDQPTNLIQRHLTPEPVCPWCGYVMSEDIAMSFGGGRMKCSECIQFSMVAAFPVTTYEYSTQRDAYDDPSMDIEAIT